LAPSLLAEGAMSLLRWPGGTPATRSPRRWAPTPTSKIWRAFWAVSSSGAATRKAKRLQPQQMSPPPARRRQRLRNSLCQPVMRLGQTHSRDTSLRHRRLDRTYQPKQRALSSLRTRNHKPRGAQLAVAPPTSVQERQARAAPWRPDHVLQMVLPTTRTPT